MTSASYAFVTGDNNENDLNQSLRPVDAVSNNNRPRTSSSMDPQPPEPDHELPVNEHTTPFFSNIHSPSSGSSSTRGSGITLNSKYRQHWLSCLLLIATSMWISATICFAFLSSSHSPRSVFSKPEKTILALNIASNLSALLLGTLVHVASDTLRWSFAASSSGVGARTFLSLSKATSLYGVVILLSSRAGLSHRIWGFQRYDNPTPMAQFRLLLILIVGILGVALLFDVGFELLYIPITNNRNDVLSGIPSFNASLVKLNPEVLPGLFFMSSQRFLGDPKSTYSFPPISRPCILSPEDCFSYVIPGDFDKISIRGRDRKQKMNIFDLAINEHERKSTTFVVEKAPAYHLEFFPIQSSSTFGSSDCRVLGNFQMPMMICLKNEGEDLVAGFTLIPPRIDVF